MLRFREIIPSGTQGILSTQLCIYDVCEKIDPSSTVANVASWAVVQRGLISLTWTLSIITRNIVRQMKFLNIRQ